MSILSYSFLHSNNSSYSYLGKFWNSHSQSDHLEKAIHLYEKEGLEKARVYLDAHKIHLILVLGVGRHGIALASLIRQAAQTNHEMIDGKAILPLLMGFHDSQSESINY